MHDAADDSAIVRSLDAPAIRRQARFDRFHCSSLSQNRFLRTVLVLPKTNHDRIVRAQN
jgi:hypothetical protein